MVALGHGREELLCQPIVRQGVNLELQTGLGLGATEDGAAAADSSIVDQDCRFAHCPADGCGDLGDGCWRGDVAGVEAHGGREGVLWRFDIEDGDLDTAVSEEVRDLSANPVATAREHDDFPVPVILV